ncbi:hypothetical protein ZHAS_00007035 [Anopheles sinensis]|uniref:Uncharacterized protein n=1 Tax=Anopheles sinensis TaxID=74873 RepID=A0A084VNP2_ANOSI|nr:hypothetical protein ZHAS_00007035 [Anopheles sinensis]
MAPGRTALSSAFVGVRFASSKAGVTAFNLDDTNSNYSGTPSIRKKSFQIYSGAGIVPKAPEVNAFAPSLTPFGSNRNLLTFWQQGRRLSPFRHVTNV